MPNFISVFTLESKYRFVDFTQVNVFEPNEMCSMSIPFKDIDPYVAISEDGLALPIATFIEQRLTGHRTRTKFDGGSQPRLGNVFHRPSDDFWFVGTTKNGFLEGKTHYFELERWEAVAWLTANLCEIPEALAISQAKPDTKPPKAPVKPQRQRRKGDTDARAIAELTRDAAMSNRQIAAVIGCNPKTLSSRKLCPRFNQAREHLKRGRNEFRRGDVWKRRDDDS